MTKKTIITDDIKKEIEELSQHFPRKSASCIEALQVVQKHHRWVSDEAVKELAKELEMSSEAVDSVATFYNLVFRKPVGRHVILVCNNVTCWMLKYEEIAAKLQEILGIEFGETTADDRFTLLTIPCLGTCDRAPAMMIDKNLHRDLTVDKIEGILEKYE